MIIMDIIALFRILSLCAYKLNYSLFDKNDIQNNGISQNDVIVVACSVDDFLASILFSQFQFFDFY